MPGMAADETSHLQDVDLAQSCLEGDEERVRALKADHFSSLFQMLVATGASPVEAQDLLSQLWIDCVVGPGRPEPLLARYNGLSPLRAWLKSIAMNRWISLKRSQAVHARAVERLEVPLADTSGIKHPASDPAQEIKHILAASIRKALESCGSEDLVLLQLVHAHQLTRRELALIWGWDESKMSRRLKDAAARIASSTLELVKKSDPHLDITWDDLLDLCAAQSVLGA